MTGGMQYGFVLPYGDARTAADLAKLAEDHGWDGFFVWESVWGIDAWVCLTAAAMVTERIRLGTMITPVSRMRPWKLASEVATLDNLTGGRVILAVGMGATDTGFDAFGEVTELRTRAELVDEGLEILTGLWNGQPFSYEGKHYQVRPIDFFPPPPPVQQPRVPIWVVGAIGRPKSMARVVRYDGLLPYVMDGVPGPLPITPELVTSTLEELAAVRGSVDGFDVVVEGTTGGDSPITRSHVEELSLAGTTWWLEAMWQSQDDLDAVKQRIQAGPPR